MRTWTRSGTSPSVAFVYRKGAGTLTSVGPLSVNWLATQIAVLTTDLQMHLS